MKEKLQKIRENAIAHRTNKVFGLSLNYKF